MSVTEHPVRFVTATSLFDGHDAAINIMRRILQARGVEVIHLGHNRSVDEVVSAVIDEDVQGVAVSSYQGGHIEYFKYLVDRLRQEGYGHVKVFGGGGGVIVADEIRELETYGVARIFSPEDGQRLGLVGMIDSMVAACDFALPAHGTVEELLGGDRHALTRAITLVEAGRLDAHLASEVAKAAEQCGPVPVLGITGTGGSGKSSLTDELILRLRLDHEDKLRVAVIAVDPTRRRGGGALLGDRIRMNAIQGGPVFFRSLATRSAVSELPQCVPAVVEICKAAGYDLVIVETPGIGQGNAAITDVADVSLYVMTPEFGAASQLEKIDMLDFADVVAINKFDRRGGEDAMRDVRRQVARNRELFDIPPEELPVYGTVASRFNDDGVTALYQELASRLAALRLAQGGGYLLPSTTKTSSAREAIVPSSRARYLADIAAEVRAYHRRTGEQAELIKSIDALETGVRTFVAEGRQPPAELSDLAAHLRGELDPASTHLLDEWPSVVEQFSPADAKNRRSTLSGSEVSRVALPRYSAAPDLYSWLRRENVPGRFPFTAGVFPFKRDSEDPARMFAGEGDPARTNRRFHLLASGQSSTRLSTAFDSVTLYGCDPDLAPDVYGKVGTSGVSVATLDDMKDLYAGFDLVSPTTSVSMTINGPAPAILAMFFNTAIDQACEKATADGRILDDADLARIRRDVLSSVRGTVQADILKEDQGQNTCLFSTDFSLKMMADIQEWFVENEVRNFYSVSISGYHIAEAGANPITQLAFTLANGFTYVEAYLARGMRVDDFAPNFSFFFSNGMDAEYTVLGRVARRIWAVAMRDRYGANERSQKLKYHVQTSGRSLHAQEMAFNDIRTTLQALCAINDNCNSLHTNAYDEAVTTPTGDSVRRALAIQMIINREWGLAMNENSLQGSFVIDELTDLVEEAVLAEFERISERGGVLGAMEVGYQRGRIQDESMLYEQRKHDGSLPIIGVNTFLGSGTAQDVVEVELARATEHEKRSQLDRLRSFQERNREEREPALDRLRHAALAGENVFAVLMDSVRHCSLGETTEALFEVGGRYRRNI
jgi:methylmalonyl-CoA mutase